MATLIEMTQTILSDIGGDEVNSITDTEESESVAKQIVATYNNMISNSIWPHTRRSFEMVPRSNSDFPTHMKLPSNLKELSQINYDVRKSTTGRKEYKKMSYVEPDDFLRKTNHRDNTSSNVMTVVDDSGVELFILNDTSPTFFTSFNDTDLVFDSFDNNVDSTLQASKTQSIGYIMPEFLLSDNSEPDLPPDAYSALLEEATSRVQWKLKEFQDMKAEQESVRQKRWLSRKSWRTNEAGRFPNYGRKKSRTRDVTFRKNQ